MKLVDLEDAIESALLPLKTAGNVASLEMLSEEVSDLEEALRRLGSRAPFLAVLYTGGNFVPVNLAAGAYIHEPEYVVLIGVHSLRSNQAAREGLYPILADVLNALSGKNLSLDIDPIRFGRADLVSWTRPIMVYAIKMSTRFAWDVAGEAA